MLGPPPAVRSDRRGCVVAGSFSPCVLASNSLAHRVNHDKPMAALPRRVSYKRIAPASAKRPRGCASWQRWIQPRLRFPDLEAMESGARWVRETAPPDLGADLARESSCGITS